MLPADLSIFHPLHPCRSSTLRRLPPRCSPQAHPRDFEEQFDPTATCSWVRDGASFGERPTVRPRSVFAAVDVGGPERELAVAVDERRRAPFERRSQSAARHVDADADRAPALRGRQRDPSVRRPLERRRGQRERLVGRELLSPAGRARPAPAPRSARGNRRAASPARSPRSRCRADRPRRRPAARAAALAALLTRLTRSSVATSTSCWAGSGRIWTSSMLMRLRPPARPSVWTPRVCCLRSAPGCSLRMVEDAHPARQACLPRRMDGDISDL